MESKLPIYLVAGLATLLLLTIGVGFFLSLKPHASLPGLPAIVTAKVGALPNEYAPAVSTKLIDLLMTWTQENRKSRLTDASRLMTGPALERFKRWANASTPALRTLQIEQRARLTPLRVTHLSDGTFITDTAVEVRRYVGGLGGAADNYVFRLRLKKVEDSGSRPTVLCIVGVQATRVASDDKLLQPVNNQPKASL